MENISTEEALTQAQQGIWLAETLGKSGSDFNTAEYVEINGHVQVDTLIKAINQTMMEAEGIYTTFNQDGDHVSQNINRPFQPAIELLDMSMEENPYNSAFLWMEESRTETQFSFADGPLFHLALLKVDAETYYWYLCIHHLVIDGYGYTLLVNRTADLYTANLLKMQPRLKPFDAVGQWLSDDEEYLNSSKLSADKDYWQELLKPNEGVSLAEGQSTIQNQFHRYSLDLEDEQVEKAYSLEEKLLASISIYLEHATRKSQVVMGLPLMNRLGTAALTVPSNTMNIVPLQIQITPEQSVFEVMMQIRKRLIESKRHGRYHQEWIRKDLGKSGSKEQIYGPIVNILPFTYEYKFGDAVGNVHQLSAGPVEDLSFQFYKQKQVNQYQLVVDGNPELYTEADVRQHAHAIIRIYQQLVEKDKKVAELSVISNDEKQHVISDVNKTKQTVQKPFFTEAIKLQARKQPDAYALAFKNTAYTYKDIDLKVEQIASLLRLKGVKKNTVIGVSLERSPEMVCLLLATLRIGAAYLPLDPSFPKKRLEYMVLHANVSYVVSTSSISKESPSLGSAELILLDEEDLNGVCMEDAFNDELISREDAAYVMYTSGSTGKPKGVVISRGALNQFLYAMDNQFSLSEQDVFLAVTTIAFDISALELYLPLMSGSKMVLAEQGDVQKPDVLGRLSEEHQVSHLQATPALWQILLEEVPESLRDVHMLVGGEALSDHLKDLMLSIGKSATNLYGPTETTIWSAVEELSADKQTVLGSPIWNTQLHVLDKSLRPVGPKTLGELYIAGEGLANGYLGRSSLTATRFIANPFGAPGSRMYQTGDLVRYEENGSLSFQGRTDSQIKLRGYRIELGEVEGVLQSHSNVRHAVASIFGKPGNERVVAYIECGELVQESDLLDFVAERLPVYMVPSQVVYLDAIPLTPNGKVDRNSLPEPESNSVFLEPQTIEEKEISYLMANILDLERVGRDDHFFSRGGNSLLAVQLIAKIRNRFQIEMNAGEIFDSPTVRQLANQVMGATVAKKMIAYERPNQIPLSNEQKRLWFLHQLDKGNPVYNIPFIIEMEGEIKPQLIEHALHDVISAHEPLRTLIVESNNKTHQKILPIKQSKKTLIERWIHLEQKESVLESVVRYSFDLEKEAAIHCQLLRMGETTATLVIVLHHIMADGWSLATLGRDLSKAYTKYLSGEETGIPLPSFQYADYSLWQEQNSSKEKLHLQSKFWTEELEGLPEQVSLPIDGKRQPTTDIEAKTFDFIIDEEIYQKLKEISQTHEASLHMVLQASLASLLTKLGAGNDLAIGTPIAGRSDEQLHDIVGLFINTVVLRTNTEGNPTFTELIERVKKHNMRAYKHSDIPFEQVVELINPKRMPGRNPLFQVMFVLQQTPEAAVKFKGVATQTRIEPVGSAKFDLTFELDERNNQFYARIEYRTDLFTEERIGDMANQWLRVLRQATSNPEKPIGALQLVDPGKIEKLKSDSVTSKKKNYHLVSYFEEVVKKHPNNVALSFKEESLTYHQLNSRANQLANELIANGVGRGDYVAVALSRSLDLASTLLAILKTGAAYVPLDPANPLERLQFIMQDVSPSCLVTSSELNHDLNTNFPVVNLDSNETNKRIRERVSTNVIGIHRSETDPAYIIYTSGSTGKPKGVRVAHQNVWRLFDETSNWYKFTSTDVWSMFHSYAFDFAVWEFWGALLHGGKVVLIPQDEARSPQGFLQRLIEEKVTILNQTPSAFYTLADHCSERPEEAKKLSLRAIIFGGEALDFAKLSSWYKVGHSAKLINMYGITETTVHVTYAEVKLDQKDHSHIGAPIPDLSVYVLDDWLQPVPDGMTGEMYVSGAGLADGYVGRPSLTAERFIANPFGEPGSRMYRTGDLAKFQKDGLLVYMGRSDKQVKIRGHRIELGEIDAVILQSKEVKQAATILYENAKKDKQLISYLVMEKSGEIEQLKAHLSSTLPEYMMPASYEVLGELPLTTNGKLDEKSLPAPVFDYAKQEAPPRTPQEQVLCELFAEVLNQPQVSIYDNFFDLGGHSLIAVELIKRLNKQFAVSLSLAVLFEEPTVAGLSEKLDTKGTSRALDVLLPLRKNGRDQPLFCVHPAGGLSWCYAGLLSQVHGDIPIYGLQARGIGRDEKMPSTITEMAKDYISQLKSIQQSGPYRLLGWSLGGNVIQEMATLLAAKGEEVSDLFILDAHPRQFYQEEGPPSEQESLIGLLALAGFDPADFISNDTLTMDDVVSILTQEGSALASLDRDTINRMRQCYINAVQCLREHKPSTFHGRTVFFRSLQLPEWLSDVGPDIWDPFFKEGVEVHDVDCRHKDMCQPGPLREIAKVVSNKLTGENYYE